MSDDTQAAPHVPAAFINALAEEGAREELVKYLQQTWNELCQARSSVPQAAWQPIETAPKDGSEIEIKGDAGPYGVTEWVGSAHWGTPVNWHRDRSTWLTGKDDAVLKLAGYIPTHWRPCTLSRPERDAPQTEADALRRKLQLHAGDVQSLSGEVEMWRERALEAEEELARLRNEPQTASADRFVTVLTPEDHAAFLSALDSPPAPSEALVNLLHVPAAFINALAEEGAREELVKYLQQTWNELCQARSSVPQAAKELADWAALPRDLYVTSVKSGDGVVFDVQCCSVPMAIGPEVRYSRADEPTDDDH